jgi:DNA repair exonuclease SbcCD ATPase subunit
MSSEEDSPDRRNQAILEQLSELIDPKDARQADLFTQVQTDLSTNAPLDRLVDLLLLLANSRPRPFGRKLNELVSYLKSHVALLEAITRDAELASLFLIGQHGSQSFTSLQKSALREQAARTRKFIASLPLNSPPQTHLLNYKTLYKRLDKLPLKIAELTALKDHMNDEDDPNQLKLGFDEVCSILETVLLFNDLLIRSRNDDHIKENDRLVAECNLYQDTIDTLTKQVNAVESAMADLQHPESPGELVQQLQRIERQYRRVRAAVEALPAQPEWPDAEHVSDLESEILRLKKESQFLRDQVSQLQKQIGNYQTTDIEKDQQIDRLVVKLQRVQEQRADAARLCQRQERQITELQGLYRDAAEQRQQLAEGQRELQRQLKHSRKDAKVAIDMSGELQMMLKRARDDVARQMEDNQLLLKHAQRNNREDRAEEVARLKAELKSALQLIEKLQNQIAEFRRQRKIGVTRYDVSEPSLGEDDDDPGSDDLFIVKPAMDALDDAIRQLEVTLHPPRKQRILSSSSG